jgi:hypothetical protein
MLAPDYGRIRYADGRPDDGAEILRVLNAIQRQRQERRLRKELVQRAQREFRPKSGDALVLRSVRPAVELGAAHALNFGHALIRCKPRQRIERRAFLVFDGDSLQGVAMYADRLADRLKTHD